MLASLYARNEAEMHIALAGRQFKPCFHAAFEQAEKYPRRMSRNNGNIDPAFNGSDAGRKRRAGMRMRHIR